MKDDISFDYLEDVVGKCSSDETKKLLELCIHALPEDEMLEVLKGTLSDDRGTFVYAWEE
jgi:hypothetical protein